MKGRAALLQALWWGAALMLGGCGSLPFLSDPAEQTAAAPLPPPKPQFVLNVQAPSGLRSLLLEYLDLARLQTAPEADSLTRGELDRLVAAAAAQTRSLLETQGYFNPQVEVERLPDEGVLPVLQVRVQPGPRTTIESSTLRVQGALDVAVEANEPSAVELLDDLRSNWALQPGEPFTQSEWDGDKKKVLSTLRTQGFLDASWSGTVAQIDATTNSAKLFAIADSGPLFRIGPISISGLDRFDEQALLPVARTWSGLPATEQVLREMQERLLGLGLFESVVVNVATAPDQADAALVEVVARELTLQTLVAGVGFSDNTGFQLTLEHTHRRVFGTRWIAKNQFLLGPKQQLWQGDLISHPLPDAYRNLVAVQAENLITDDETRVSARLRAGRTTEDTRIARLYFAEYAWARLETDAGSNTSSALSANYHWTWRGVDNLRAPTKGLIWALQGGAGLATGSVTDASTGLSQDDSGPFARAYGRAVGFWPLGNDWFGSARLELGEVFVQQALTVPDTLLFRAGGDDSVRGYPYRSLGPMAGGSVVSGSKLFTASVQVEHPIFASQPDLLYALFIDAGNAANSWTELKPVLGYGVGVHWRSPVGPLRIDLAYGQELKRLRLSFSVGIAF